MTRPAEAPQFVQPEGESLGDRYGQFVPEIGAHQDAADAQPSDADLHARGHNVPLTEEEKEAGRRAIEEAKRTIWPQQ